MPFHWIRKLAIGVLILAYHATGSWAAPFTGDGTSEIRRLGYSIQVGTFARYESAEQLAAKLQDQGIDAYFFKTDDGVFAVRFGDYATRSQARQAAKALAVSRIIESYFIAAPIAAPLEPVDTMPPASASKPTPDSMSRYTPSKPGPKSSPQPKSSLAPKSSPKLKYNRELAENAARTAESFVGIPYGLGQNSSIEGMDGGAFVKAVFYLCGIDIPATSAEQFKAGKKISESDLADGDLVFFGNANQVSHVGIYVGKGKFVHVPQANQEVKLVELQRPGFSKKFLGARRYY